MKLPDKNVKKGRYRGRFGQVLCVKGAMCLDTEDHLSVYINIYHTFQG